MLMPLYVIIGVIHSIWCTKQQAKLLSIAPTWKEYAKNLIFVVAGICLILFSSTIINFIVNLTNYIADVGDYPFSNPESIQGGLLAWMARQFAFAGAIASLGFMLAGAVITISAGRRPYLIGASILVILSLVYQVATMLTAAAV